jgi:hypothetical protein
MKNRAGQGGIASYVNLIAKGWIILPFACVNQAVLLSLTVGFAIKKR